MFARNCPRSWPALVVALALLARCSQEQAPAAQPTASADSASAADTGAATKTDASANAQDSAVAVDTGPAAASKLKLTSVEPAQSSTSGGDTVMIYGDGFASDIGVLFGGTPVPAENIFVVDAKTLSVQTPPHEAGLVDVTVVIPGDPPISAELPDALLYFNDLVVTKCEPKEGPVAGGTPIAITGTGFSGNTQVLIGGKPAIGVQVVSDDQVICTTPPGTFGAAPVHVINQRGAGLLKNGYFYTAPPVLTGVAPGAGPSAGGTTATVTGIGLGKDTEIRFGAAQGAVAEVGKGWIKVVTPPGKGVVDVSAQGKYGTAVLASAYVYTDDQGQAGAKILTVSPKSGPVGGGNTIAIVATGLVSTSDTTLLIGNKSAKIASVVAKDHVVMAVVPKGTAAGSVDLTLLTSKGSDTLKGGYTYSDALSLSSIAPSSGPPDGNTKVVLKGTGFSKGSVTVKIGALPASNVVVVSDTEIQAITPPGSPGYVDVVVATGSDLAVIKGGYAYTGKDLKLFVPYPNTGAQAGGTYVHVHGNGFGPSMEVRFGGNLATHFVFIDSGHVTCKTPPGKVGAVDVEVALNGQKSTLKNGFTYFNPANAYGGTWGADIDGALNVTVLDADSGDPVADAFTMLWTSPATPYQGYTNAAGQITFSGDDVYGKQMVSASKTGYESASVVLFDATNVTLLMTPIPPPSPGNPPPPPPVPSVSGKVIGLDKYVFVPVGSCNDALNKGQAPGGQCQTCFDDSSCGGGMQCVDLGSGNGKRCVKSCADSCGGTFKCYAYGEKAVCAPAAGEVTSVCYHSKQTILSRDNWPPEGNGFEASAKNGYKYKITTAYGEMAIVCFGGYKVQGAVLVATDANSMQKFTPTVMGVKRHLMVVPKEKYENVDVQLTVPLTAKANVRLDVPQKWPLAPKPNVQSFIVTAGWAHLVFGGDGVIRIPGLDQKNLAPYEETDADKLELERLPSALAGDIHDARLSIIALNVQIDQNIATGENVQVPVSITVKNDLKDFGNDAMLRKLGTNDFEVLPTGVPKNIHGLWGTSANNLYAVGAQGTLVHWNGGGWTVQKALGDGKADLKAVHGADANHVWAVGWNGVAGTFNGTGWKDLPALSGIANYNGVFGAPLASAPGGYDAWIASAQGIYRVAEVNGKVGVTKYNPSPGGNFLGIHGSDASHVWAVGMYGSLAFWDGNVWKAQVSGTSIALRSVWAASDKLVFAVGEKGQILRYDGATWKAMQSPTLNTLYSVWGTGPDDVWASGNKGTLLHFDGKKWAQAQTPAVDKTLNAVWATSKGDVFALGEQELVLGPILYAPLATTPKEGQVLVGNTLKWTVDPQTVEPHFNYVTIGIPGMGPDTPVWNIMTKGSLSEVELPDFPTIQGTPGIPKGKPLRLTIIRGYKEGFDIDHYDNKDLNTLSWRSWSLHTFMFVRQ